MPKKVYYLDKGENESISISWGMSWKNTTVSYDGRELGIIKNQKELKKGHEFDIDDGRKLSIRLKGQFYPELELLVNGEVVEGSPTDPKVQLKSVYSFAFWLGLINVIAGILAIVLENAFLQKIGLGYGSIIFGGIIALLSYGVKRKSMVAMALLYGVMIIDILSIFLLIGESDANPTNGILMKLFFLVILFKGFGAIKALNRADKNKVESPVQS
ncbi:hypothetical protein [Aureibacter tunicatorum]|uniref:Uncharacterized protein n=1 Tax=Aureibacter tunicatorum TaxID=866807 RepID=A0AAE3XSD7_9BACT|nr:hypothetical protein [Aureibacter tunicatorum]MDR6240649.1 hypothetical protein [Aureibacter tunicatorum]BDD06490.1 hypothetical protein AUTU_39730 [Aureibacter tunicatorum]